MTDNKNNQLDPIIEFLIKNGADLNFLIADQNPVDYAIDNHEYALLQQLLKFGWKADDEYEGTNKINELLIETINSGDAENAIGLIESGADIKNIYPDKYPLLIYVMLYANKQNMPQLLSLVPFLLRAGADVEEKYESHDKVIYSPLKVALLLKNDDFKTAQILINYGANVNAQLFYQSILTHFKHRRDSDSSVVDFLISHGAK